MKIISKKLYIKPGCIRSVHVYQSGRAQWICTLEGKQYSVSGIVSGMNFIPNPERKYLVDAYVPQRVNRKKNNVLINRNTPKRITGDCIFGGEQRQVTFTGSHRSKGWISYQNKRVKVLVDKFGIATEA